MKKYYQLKKVDLKLIFIVFIFAKILGVATIFFASQILPPENFPYKDLLNRFYLPHLWMSHANFDGIQYIIIAREGYYNFNQAFFPMYPLLLRSAGMFLNYIYAGVILSNIFLFTLLVLFVRFLREMKIKEENILWTILFLIFFPTSFFLGSIYPTSFFLLLILLFFYGFLKNKKILVLITGFLAGITTVNGILLFAAVVGVIFINRKINKISLIALISPVIGLLVYSAYLYKTTSDALYFFHSQVAFGANRSTELIILPQVIYRYIKIFITSEYNYQLFISYLEFITFIFSFILVLYFLYFVYKKKRLEYNIGLLIGFFSMGNLIISPLTGTFLSIPRFVLYSISFFIILPFIFKSKIIRILVLVAFGILQVILIACFSQGYFVS